MNQELLYKIIFADAKGENGVKISVIGKSMLPIVSERDIVTVRRFNEYKIGDILVYLYKGELLIHRLLKFDNGKLLCKGDNSFRLEDVILEDVIGKVVLINDENVPHISNNVIVLSYFVNRIFRKFKYDIKKTTQSGIYQHYYNKIRGIYDNNLLYCKNEDVNIVLTKNIFNETYSSCYDSMFQLKMRGEILKYLEVACDMNTLLNYLCHIYNVEKTIIFDIADDIITRMIVTGEVMVYANK